MFGKSLNENGGDRRTSDGQHRIGTKVVKEVMIKGTGRRNGRGVGGGGESEGCFLK
jgi:hypothetical protein